jgi:stage V sporulation protein B
VTAENSDRDKAKGGLDEAGASRGGLFVLFAKIYFLAAGLLQQTLLPRILGDAQAGALSLILSASNIPNNVMVSAATLGVSRAVAGSRGNEHDALRKTLRVHVIVSAVVTLAFAALSSAIASYQNAPANRLPLLAMSGVLGVYGVYAALIGYLNGRGRFGKQASLDIVAATLRTIGLLALGAIFLHAGAATATVSSLFAGGAPLGAALGAVLASTLVFALAAVWVRRDVAGLPTGQAASAADPGVYLRGLVPLVVAQTFVNALMQSDIQVLGHYLVPPDVPDGRALANEWILVYRACQLFAFLPYQLLFSVTQVLFPMLARTKSEGSEEDIRRLVQRGARIGCILLGAMVAIVAALPASLIAFAYKPDIAARGASSLRVLALGQACFALMSLANTVLVSLGKNRTAVAVTASSLALVIGLLSFILPRRAFGAEMLEACALGTTLALAAGVVVAMVVLQKTVGAFIPAPTLVRVTAAVVALTLAGRGIPLLPRLLVPFAALGIGVLYLAALVVTRELTRDDFSLLGRLRRRA